MSDRKSGTRESGISRRELLKRGAVVGGTLVWAAPLIQSLAPPAYAQYATCGCCYCWSGSDKQNPDKDTLGQDGCLTFHANPTACAEFCGSSFAPGGPFDFSEQCCSTNDLCDGNTRNDPGPNGCFCS